MSRLIVKNLPSKVSVHCALVYWLLGKRDQIIFNISVKSNTTGDYSDRLLTKISCFFCNVDHALGIYY